MDTNTEKTIFTDENNNEVTIEEAILSTTQDMQDLVNEKLPKIEITEDLLDTTKTLMQNVSEYEFLIPEDSITLPLMESISTGKNAEIDPDFVRRYFELDEAQKKLTAELTKAKNYIKDFIENRELKDALARIIEEDFESLMGRKIRREDIQKFIKRCSLAGGNKAIVISKELLSDSELLDEIEEKSNSGKVTYNPSGLECLQGWIKVILSASLKEP